MNCINNRTLLEKADLVIADLTAGGGYLRPATAQKFMRLLIKKSVLMQMATVMPMSSPKKPLPKIKFGGRVLRAGREATALTEAERSKPRVSSVELDAKLFKGEVRLSDEVLEDNIERSQLRQTIMEMMGEAIARDLEEVVINGDTLSTDPFLAELDGILKQAQTNIVNANGEPITQDILTDMLKVLPSEHLRDKVAMRFFTGVGAELDYQNKLSKRESSGGDRYLEKDVPAMFSGVPIRPVPLFPEKLGPTGDQSAVLLCNPKNIHVGLWRKIRMESDRDISTGEVKIVASVRADVKFADESGVAKAINVQ